MRWRPEGAGRYLLVFADGLLIVTRGAYRRLPHPPAEPEPAGSKAVKAMAALAGVALGPVSQLADLAGHLAEGLTDIAVDRVADRYARAHPEREREHREKIASWQQAFAAEAAGADGVIPVPRCDLVRVSIVPFMAYGVNLHVRDDGSRMSAYTLALQTPARTAAETAQLYFVGRIRTETAWLARQYAGQELAAEDLRARLTSDMRAVLPQYAALPLCARWLDRALPGWRSAIQLSTAARPARQPRTSPTTNTLAARRAPQDVQADLLRGGRVQGTVWPGSGMRADGSSPAIMST